MEGRRIDFRKAFLDELLAVEQYIGRHDGQRGRAFTKAVVDFAYAVVGTVPEGFAAYRHPLLPEVPLRRAIFRRDYALLYRVSDETIDFVYFHHTRRDISRQALES